MFADAVFRQRWSARVAFTARNYYESRGASIVVIAACDRVCRTQSGHVHSNVVSYASLECVIVARQIELDASSDMKLEPLKGAFTRIKVTIGSIRDPPYHWI